MGRQGKSALLRVSLRLFEWGMCSHCSTVRGADVFAVPSLFTLNSRRDSNVKFNFPYMESKGFLIGKEFLRTLQEGR